MEEHRQAHRLSNEDRSTLTESLRAGLAGRAEVLFAYLFGSVLGDLPVHDIDVGVYVAGVSEEAVTACAIDIGTMLQARTKVPVDVRVMNYAPVSVQYKVLRGELLFERDENARAAVAERIVQRYLDIEPLLRKGFQEAFAA